MNDADRDPTDHQPDRSPDPDAPPEPAAVTGRGESPPVAEVDEGERLAPPRRSDPLAAGVAVLVMASLLACAAIVLIASGNA